MLCLFRRTMQTKTCIKILLGPIKLYTKIYVCGVCTPWDLWTLTYILSPFGGKLQGIYACIGGTGNGGVKVHIVPFGKSSHAAWPNTTFLILHIKPQIYLLSSLSIGLSLVTWRIRVFIRLYIHHHAHLALIICLIWMSAALCVNM